jgi:hypothetical protein
MLSQKLAISSALVLPATFLLQQQQQQQQKKKKKQKKQKKQRQQQWMKTRGQTCMRCIHNCITSYPAANGT